MLGRKLDMVCSTQPYGKEVRYSMAPNSEPAMDGETPTVSEREPGWILAGKVRSKEVSVPAASEPPCGCASLTPGMLTGRSNCMASDSSLVRALPVTVAVWTCCARTRQSTRASPRLGIQMRSEEHTSE